MIRSACIIIFLLPGIGTHAQDTLKKISFKWGAEFWGTYVNYPDDPKTNRPLELDANSFNSLDTLKDAPIRHGAYYVAFKTTTTLTPGIKIKFDLYAEHRGISYGIYNKKNLVLYPVLQLDIKDSLHLLKHKLIVEAKVGDLLNERLDEGLFIYNVDAQGGKAAASSGKWKLSAAWYGDFFAGIGLNIDDALAVSLSRSFGKQNKTVAGLSVNSLYPPGQAIADHLYYSMFVRHKLTNIDIYAQAGFQGSYNKGFFYSRGIKPQAAFVVGGNAVYGQQKFSGTTVLEARYYGSSVNFLHHDPRLRYRDANGGLYANTVGEYLYPLRKYDNLFSQWAVFTEYFGYNVLGLSLTGNANYPVTQKTSAILEYDLNYITATKDSYYNTAFITPQILYAFLTFGYYYTPVKTIKAGITITNKGMNLNLGYPTLYQFKHFYLGFKIRCAI